MAYRARPFVSKVCPQCGSSFDSNHQRRLYCSASCNTLAWLARKAQRFPLSSVTVSAGGSQEPATAPSQTLALNAQNMGALILASAAGTLAAEGVGSLARAVLGQPTIEQQLLAELQALRAALQPPVEPAVAPALPSGASGERGPEAWRVTGHTRWLRLTGETAPTLFHELAQGERRRYLQRERGLLLEPGAGGRYLPVQELPAAAPAAPALAPPAPAARPVASEPTSPAAPAPRARRAAKPPLSASQQAELTRQLEELLLAQLPELLPPGPAPVAEPQHKAEPRAVPSTSAQSE